MAGDGKAASLPRLHQAPQRWLNPTDFYVLWIDTPGDQVFTDLDVCVIGVKPVPIYRFPYHPPKPPLMRIIFLEKAYI